MKRSKRLITLVAVLAVACVATFALTKYEKKQEEIQNSDAVIFPTSSIANAYICACLSTAICARLRDLGCEVEVFMSANLDGGYERNEHYFEKYTRLY